MTIDGLSGEGRRTVDHRRYGVAVNGGSRRPTADREGSEFFWIGLHDSDVESVFRWTHNAPVTWSRWDVGKPSNADDSYDCVAMETERASSFGLVVAWRDFPCDNNSFLFSYICQTPPEDSLSCQEGLDKCGPPPEAPDETGTSNCCYVMNSTKVTWQEASVFCNQTQGHLAASNSIYEDSAVGLAAGGQAVFLGITDVFTETLYRTDLGAVIRFSKWMTGRPDGGAAENCALRMPTGLWDDVDCASTHAFVCQYPRDYKCGSAPLMTYAEKQTTNDTVTYTCHPGYAVPGGATVVSVTCQCDTNWSTLASCTKNPRPQNVPSGINDDYDQLPPATSGDNTSDTTGYDVTRAPTTATHSWPTSETAHDPTSSRATIDVSNSKQNPADQSSFVETFGAQTVYTTEFDVTTALTTAPYWPVLEDRPTDVSGGSRTTTDHLTSATSGDKTSDKTGYDVTPSPTTTHYWSTSEPAHVTSSPRTAVDDSNSEQNPTDHTELEDTDVSGLPRTTAAKPQQNATPSSGVNGSEVSSTTAHSGGRTAYQPGNDVTSTPTLPYWSISEAANVTPSSNMKSGVNQHDTKTDGKETLRTGPGLICEQPLRIPNAHLFLSGYEPGDTAQYSCYHGYGFPDGSRTRSLLCLETFFWHGEIRTCEVKLCSRAPEVENARVVSGSRRVGLILWYACDPGTRAPGGRRVFYILCSPDQTWNRQPPPCARTCPELPFIEHASTDIYTGTLTSSVRFYCDPGHRFINGATEQDFVCNSHAHWLIRDGEGCHVDRCEPFRPPKNGQINDSSATYGTVVKASCDVGFRFPDRRLARTYICLERGRWSNDLQDCEGTHCPELSDVPGSVVRPPGSIHLTHFGAHVTYRCRSGMRMEDGQISRTLSCQANSKWNDSLPTCEVGRCPPVPRILNATSNSTSAHDGSVVAVLCQDGFRLPDGATGVILTCQNQSWNVTETACKELYCPASNRIPHSDPNTTDATAHARGSVVRHFCHPGHTSRESLAYFDLRCSPEGQWVGHHAACTPIKCGPAPVIVNTTNAVSDWRYGTALSYTCFPGQWFSRSARVVTSRCLADGSWSHDLNKCKGITCLAIWTWEDRMTVDRNDVTVGAIVNFSCDVTIRPSGATWAVAVCGSDGNWHPPIAGCEDVPKNMSTRTPTEADSSYVIGLVAVIVTSFTFLSIVVLDLATVGLRVASSQ